MTKSKCKCKVTGDVLKICKSCSAKRFEEFENELSKDPYWVNKFAKMGVMLRGNQ